MICAVLLAGGQGRRMGGPKALLVVDGESLVVAHVRRLRALGCPRIVVVVPAAIAAQVRALVPDALVLGRDTPTMAGSLAAALAALRPPPHERLLVTPIDLRPAQLATLRKLVATEGEAVVPRHAGRRGHPVVARAALLTAGDAARPLRERLAGAARVEVEVDDAAVLGDFDHPADLRADAR